ncbi:MAG: hypothetical protein HY861_01205 [Chlamydiia bacterium]|nr:hypothetical protein [Chlamydiia bacterium]
MKVQVNNYQQVIQAVSENIDERRKDASLDRRGIYFHCIGDHVVEINHFSTGFWGRLIAWLRGYREGRESLVEVAQKIGTVFQKIYQNGLVPAQDVKQNTLAVLRNIQRGLSTGEYSIKRTEKLKKLRKKREAINEKIRAGVIPEAELQLKLRRNKIANECMGILREEIRDRVQIGKIIEAVQGVAGGFARVPRDEGEDLKKIQEALDALRQDQDESLTDELAKMQAELQQIKNNPAAEANGAEAVLEQNREPALPNMQMLRADFVKKAEDRRMGAGVDLTDADSVNKAIVQERQRLAGLMQRQGQEMDLGERNRIDLLRAFWNSDASLPVVEVLLKKGLITITAEGVMDTQSREQMIDRFFHKDLTLNEIEARIIDNAWQVIQERQQKRRDAVLQPRPPVHSSAVVVAQQVPPVAQSPRSPLTTTGISVIEDYFPSVKPVADHAAEGERHDACCLTDRIQENYFQ